MNSIELDHLRAFLAVAEAKGFSRAAVLERTTQPTLSRQVKALEDSLGRPLLIREKRTVALTTFGQRVLQQARAILDQVDALAVLEREPEGTISGILHVGAADSLIISRTPRLLRGFLRAHRAVQVHVHTGSSPDILSWVREGRCDVGLCMLPQQYPGLKFQVLWKDRFVALAPPRHPLAGKRVNLADFAGQRQLVIQPGTLSFQVLTAEFQSAGLPFIPDMSFDSFSLIVEFVAAGVGVGIASKAAALPALKRQRVARVRLPAIERLQRNLGYVLHATREPAGPLAAFLDHVRTRVAK